MSTHVSNEESNQSFKVLKQMDKHYGEPVKKDKGTTKHKHHTGKSFNNYSIQDLLQMEEEEIFND